MAGWLIAEVLEVNAEKLILLANKIPQNLQDTIIQEPLAVDFLRTVPKFNVTDREEIRKIIEKAGCRN